MEGYCVFAGTDTTGCVRIPASLCGIFGFRPSHGAVSTIGVFPNAQSLDTIGKMHNGVIFAMIMISCKLYVSNLYILHHLFLVACFKNRTIRYTY